MSKRIKNILSIAAVVIYSIFNSVFNNKEGFDFTSILIAGAIGVVVYVILDFIFPSKK